MDTCMCVRVRVRVSLRKYAKMCAVFNGLERKTRKTFGRLATVGNKWHYSFETFEMLRNSTIEIVLLAKTKQNNENLCASAWRTFILQCFQYFRWSLTVLFFYTLNVDTVYPSIAQKLWFIVMKNEITSDNSSMKSYENHEYFTKNPTTRSRNFWIDFVLAIVWIQSTNIEMWFEQKIQSSNSVCFYYL